MEEGVFWLSIPAPPSDNNLTRKGRFTSYPTADYKAWLQVCAPILQEELTGGDGYKPDGVNWWDVSIVFRLKTGDVSNRIKAALDLLQGKHYDTKTQRIASGPGLFCDDKQVRSVSVRAEAIRCEEATCIIEAVPTPAPVDEREKARLAAREARQQARRALLAARADERVRALAAAAVARLETRVERGAE